MERGAAKLKKKKKKSQRTTRSGRFYAEKAIHRVGGLHF